MFESLIITLREGIEASLVIGILIAYLNKIGRNALSKFVYWGLGIAVLGSALGAIVLQMIVINEEAYEGFLYLTAAVFVSTMLYWMQQHSKTIKREIEDKALRIHESRKGQALGLFIFTFLMVFREGVETVLFLSAVGLSTEKLLSFTGGIMGLFLAVLFCIAFIKGTVKIDLARFFKVSTWVLAIFVLQLIINGLHELSEAQILPASRAEMALVGPIVRNNAFFVLALLCIPIFIFLISSRKIEPEKNFLVEAGGPERRLELARLRNQKRWRSTWAVTSFLVILFLGSHAVYSSRAKVLDPPLLIQSEGGWIKIPIKDVADGKLHRFGFMVGDKLVRFLAIERKKDDFATAFDLCEICGDYGYVQEGENILCLNCVAAIYPPTIGVRGGCNPIPLKSTQEALSLMIHASDLETYQDHFTTKILPEVQCEICGMKMHLEEVSEKVSRGSKTYYLCAMESCKKEIRRRDLENLK